VVLSVEERVFISAQQLSERTVFMNLNVNKIFGGECSYVALCRYNKKGKLMGLILGKIRKKIMDLPSFSRSLCDTVGRDGEKVEELILF
jgi:hypothetical protein